MNIHSAGSIRPRLHLPKALLSSGMQERPGPRPAPPSSPTLSTIELRRIVAEMIG